MVEVRDVATRQTDWQMNLEIEAEAKGTSLLKVKCRGEFRITRIGSIFRSHTTDTILLE